MDRLIFYLHVLHKALAVNYTSLPLDRFLSIVVFLDNIDCLESDFVDTFSGPKRITSNIISIRTKPF